LSLLCPGGLTDVSVEFLGGENVTESGMTYTLYGMADEELIAGQGPMDFASLEEGSYVVITEDANACKDTVTFEVTSPAPIDAAFEIADDNSCFGEADALIVLPDSTLTGGTGSLLPVAQDPQGSTINPEFVEGIYTWDGLECIDGDGEFVFTVSDANGCTRKDTLQVNCPEPFDVAFASGDVVCTGDADGFIAVEASGGSGSLYLTNSTETVPAAEGLMDLGPSIYQVYVLDSLNCSSDTAVIQINEPAALEINIGDITNPSCGLDCDGEVALTALGGSGDLDVSYFNTTTGGVSADSIGLCAGDYVATVTDTSGCQLTALFEVDAPAPLDFLIAPSNATCTGMSNGSADIFPIGGTVSDEEYDWVVLDTAGNVANLNNLSEMTYTALVTDQIGCSYAETFDIGIDFVTDMELNTLTSPVTCWNAADGTATVSVNGGEAPFTFEWSDPFVQTTSTAVGLTEDTYTVVVTDALGCRRTASQFVDAIEGCLFIADALTPNGDNNNDDWVVGGLEDYPDSKVMVFNRWGQKLFETVGGQERWDGRFNGARLPVADYYYTIELFPEALPIRGTVTIKY
ncbi:MAG: T9SS type B sorting domain-containing protein, partial [Flavobacteriales bacterium]